MKGFTLDDAEMYQMLTIFKDDLEEYIGEFDGEITIDMGTYSIRVFLDEDKYICIEAVIRKLEEFFTSSQFNRDEFDIYTEGNYSIEIHYL